MPKANNKTIKSKFATPKVGELAKSQVQVLSPSKNQQRTRKQETKKPKNLKKKKTQKTKTKNQKNKKQKKKKKQNTKNKIIGS